MGGKETMMGTEALFALLSSLSSVGWKEREGKQGD